MSMANSLSASFKPVEGACMECGGELRNYQVISAGGWFDVVKCAECLASLKRTPWRRLGFVERDDVSRILAESNEPRIGRSDVTEIQARSNGSAT